MIKLEIFSTSLFLEQLQESVSPTNTDTYERTKANSELILLSNLINKVHIQIASKCRGIWENLEQALDGSGFHKIVALFRVLSSKRHRRCE